MLFTTREQTEILQGEMSSEKATIIESQNLSLQLGGRLILQNVTLSVSQGEFITILGPNGAGKSTFLKLTLGLYQPTAGSLLVLGNAPRTGNKSIGYAPQHRTLEAGLSLRAQDIVRFGLDGEKWGLPLPSKKAQEAVDRALRDVDMLHLKDAPVGKLSGGEQQRLLIAQALLTKPKILLLDEPLASLDITHAQDIVTLIARIAAERGITVLLVTHDINPVLSVTDRVIYMAHTHSAIGKPDEIVTTDMLTRLYGSAIDVIRTKGRVIVLGEQ